MIYYRYMNILFYRKLIFVGLLCHSCFAYTTDEITNPKQKKNTAKEYLSSAFNLNCIDCNKQVANYSRKSTDWYSKTSLDEATIKKLPNFICGAYIEPKEHTASLHNDTIDLTAEYFSIDKKQIAKLWEKVTIKFKSYYAECDQAKIDKAISYYSLIGNVKIRQNGILLIGDKANIYGKTKQAEIINSDFILYSSNSHGHADYAKINNDEVLVLTNAYYTSCPPNKELWSIAGKEIRYNNQKKSLVINNARFKIYDTSVLWLPYLEFSTDLNQSKTGFLAPNINYASTHKLDISLPFYWHMAPNYDTTVTLRYLQNKGILVNNEFRYLTKMLAGEHQGNLYTSLFALPNNKTKKDALNNNYYISYKHKSNFNNNASLTVDYNKAQNYKYFTELQLEKVPTKYLKQHIEASWSTASKQTNYKITPTIEFYDVQKLDQDFIVPYKKAPSLSLQGYYQVNDHLKLTTDLSYSKFINKNSHVINDTTLKKYGSSLIGGDRFYTNLVAKYRQDIGRFYFKPAINMTALQYNIANANSNIIVPYLSSVYADFTISDFTNSPRYIGGGFNVKCGAKIVKSISSENNSWNLTFKPAIKYAISPYVGNQYMSPLFDSHLIKINSYSSLWHNNRFSGKDRIADQNQLALGISSKLTNADETITYSFKLGQILYFANRKVWISPQANAAYYRDTPDLDLQQEQQTIEQQLLTSYSPVVFDSYIDINNKFKLQTTGAIDVDKNKFNSFLLGADYYFFDKYSLKLVYNYEQRSDSFVKDSNNNYIIENNKPKKAKNNLNELGVSLYYPISEQINIISGIKYDIMNSKTTDFLAGIEYSNCCFQLRLVANRWLDRSNNFYAPQEHYRILLNFKLYGLSFTDGCYNSIASKLEDYTKIEI